MTTRSDVLIAARSALHPSGHLVFETRIPAARGWEERTAGRSTSVARTIEGPVESWVDLTAVDLPFVSFRWTYRFLDDGTELASDSTLRFREHEEITESLDAAGFVVREARDAPDRPGREWVFVAVARD